MRALTILIVAITLALTPSTGQAAVDLVEAFGSLPSFSSPVDIQNARDGSNRLFVVEQIGRIRVFDNNPLVSEVKTFLDIQNSVTVNFEMGLLGLAFAPEFPDSPYVFVNYTVQDPGRRTVIARFELDPSNPDSLLPESELEIITYTQPFPNHNAGAIAFGHDDLLYITSGDGGSGGDPFGNGQNLATLLGAILRIDVSDATSAQPYVVPPDNPFVGVPNTAPEIYAYGLRNPWRMSFDSLTGELWVGDVGQVTWEEIDIIEKGGNYGWNVVEGFHCYPPGAVCDSTAFDEPVWEYIHPMSAGRSVTGGYVYRGGLIQELIGKYVYADYLTGETWTLEYDGVTATNTPLIDAPFLISSFGVDESDNLFVCNYGAGRIFRFVPIATGIEDGEVPTVESVLGQNRPNPFNPSTTIEFTLDASASVQVDVYDVRGAFVARLIDREYTAGVHPLTWDGRNSAGQRQVSGVYFYQLRINGEVSETKRMVLLK